MQICRSATEARQRISCYWDTDIPKALRHAEGNIRHSLRLLIWYFSPSKGCLKLKFSDPRLIKSVKANESMRTFLKTLGHKKMKTPSAIQTIGGGVLPHADVHVFFFFLDPDFFWCYEVTLLEDIYDGLRSIIDAKD